MVYFLITKKNTKKFLTHKSPHHPKKRIIKPFANKLIFFLTHEKMSGEIVEQSLFKAPKKKITMWFETTPHMSGGCTLSGFKKMKR